MVELVDKLRVALFQGCLQLRLCGEGVVGDKAPPDQVVEVNCNVVVDVEVCVCLLGWR